MMSALSSRLPKLQGVTRPFVWIYLSLIFLVSVGLFCYDRIEIENQIKHVESNERYQVEMYLNAARQAIWEISSDLRGLSARHLISKYLSSGDENSGALLNDEFMALAAAKKYYDQIRLIDLNGKEMLRVNCVNGSPEIIPQHKMQTKSNRYYVNEARLLDRGQIYISPLDLNVDHGQIEWPIKPMLRLAIPLFDQQGEKKAVLVTNYLGRDLLSRLAAFQKNAPGQLMLLNRQGYWLKGPWPDAEWGFMFPQSRDKTFAQRFPRVWKIISSQPTGQISLASGMFTFAILEIYESAGQPKETYRHIWRVVSWVSPKAIASLLWPLQKKHIIIFFTLALLCLPLAGLAAKTVAQKRRVNEELSQHYQQREVMNSLLQLAQQDLTMRDFLSRTLKEVLSVPWLAVENKGSIFLVENDPEMLELKVQQNLPEPVLIDCARVPFGKCLCGNAASKQKLLFAPDIDDSHEIVYEGIKPHGHFCVPILSKEKSLGVLSLYTVSGHQLNKHEVKFLTVVANTLAAVIERKRAAENLQKSEQSLSAAQKIAHMGNWEWDIVNDTVTWSAEIYNLLGLDPEEFDPSYDTFMKAIHPEDKEFIEESFKKMFHQDESFNIEHRIVHPDGNQRIVHEVGEVFRDETGKPLLMIGTVQDITERKQAEDQLEMARKVFHNAIEGITVTDAQGNIEYVNRAFTRITGYSQEEILGQNPRILRSDRHLPDFYTQMWESIAKKGHWAGEIWNRRKSGEAYPEKLNITAIKDASGHNKNFVGVFHDISDIKRAEEEIKYKTNYDFLTGLPNKTLFDELLTLAIARAQREDNGLAALSINLDNFSHVNTNHGYARGDSLLRVIGERLRKLLRKQDAVARSGEDHFLIFVESDKEGHEASFVAQRLQKAISEFFEIEGSKIYITASIGVAVFPQDGRDTKTLLANADIAMRQAKAEGPNEIKLFDSAMNQQVEWRTATTVALRQALERHEFLVYYQPKVELDSANIRGMEALVRWQRPNEGLIPPDDFIPLAEATGLIVPIGEWVLREACRQTAIWRKSGLPDLRVAVNLSARQMQEPELMKTILAIITETGLPAEGLELEITESAIMTDFKAAESFFRQLREIGVSISLDDFGTGYSSLSYLRRLPVDSVKIDKSFVDDLPDDPEAVAVVTSIISMTHSLNLKVVAEGAETKKQLDFLRLIHCDTVQGYIFSPPLPSDEFHKLLAERRNWNALKGQT